MSDDRRYALKYTLRPSFGGYMPSDVDSEFDGLCDSILLCSILINEEDGACSTAFLGVDGKSNSPMSDDDMWRTWAVLAHRLSRSETLGEGRKRVCASVHELVSAALKSARAE